MSEKERARKGVTRSADEKEMATKKSSGGKKEGDGEGDMRRRARGEREVNASHQY